MANVKLLTEEQFYKWIPSPWIEEDPTPQDLVVKELVKILTNDLVKRKTKLNSFHKLVFYIRYLKDYVQANIDVQSDNLYKDKLSDFILNSYKFNNLKKSFPLLNFNKLNNYHKFKKIKNQLQSTTYTNTNIFKRINLGLKLLFSKLIEFINSIIFRPFKFIFDIIITFIKKEARNFMFLIYLTLFIYLIVFGYKVYQLQRKLNIFNFMRKDVLYTLFLIYLILFIFLVYKLYSNFFII